MTKNEEGAQNFETALKRLEAIVAAMESGELDLDTMIASFAEGQQLLQFCTRKLNEVEAKIEAIVNSTPDRVATQPFTVSEDREEV